MSTPQYNKLVEKVRDWSNRKEAATIPDEVIEDCLRYAADDCYRDLRVPPLEFTALYEVGFTNNNQNERYTRIEAPADLTEFSYIRVLPNSPNTIEPVFHQITDNRTFFDQRSEKYNAVYWMWQGDSIYIRPQLKEGTVLELHYYRRLPDLEATFDVMPINYITGLPDSDQPYLELGGTEPLFFVGDLVFATEEEAQEYVDEQGGTVATKFYSGKEVDNWLRDSNERLLLWGALYHAGAYLIDEVMEGRYQKKFMENIAELNREERMRRAKGGNVQIHTNTGGLI